MGFTLIKGYFHLNAGIPDGDSVRFMADDNQLFDRLASSAVKYKADGTVMLRYEAIDTVEKAARRDWAERSREANFSYLRGELGGDNICRGYILSRSTDGANGRPVSFVYAGEPDEADGADIHLEADRVRMSVNHKLVHDGIAYVMFYRTLYAEVRATMTEAFVDARREVRGIHADDASTSGVTLISHADVETIAPIFPKLWRRLDHYLRSHEGLGDFIKYLQRLGTDRLTTISDSRYIAFDNVLKVEGNTVRMNYAPDDMLFNE